MEVLRLVSCLLWLRNGLQKVIVCTNGFTGSQLVPRFSEALLVFECGWAWPAYCSFTPEWAETGDSYAGLRHHG